MLSEYIDMGNFLPLRSSEVVHRVVEILKFFNTRTCQLVLGAGAMQVPIIFSNQLMCMFTTIFHRNLCTETLKGLEYLTEKLSVY